MYQHPNNVNIFDHLEQWVGNKRGAYELNGLSMSYVKCKPTDNPAAYIDIDTTTLVARATVWQSMDVNLEAIASDGENLFFENKRVVDIEELLDLLSAFLIRCQQLT